MHPLEALLRAIDAAAPEPWYPRQHAERAGIAVESLNYFLEHLWLDGLLQKAAGSPMTGAGLVLSPAGKAVLGDPAAIARLCAGEPLQAGDRGGIIRATVRTESKPIITRILLGINIAVFLWELHLAHAKQIAQDFLTMFGAGPAGVNEVLHRTGSVEGADLVRGEWWRLLTCCFVHIGGLHLLCNMYVLRGLGRNAEQMWGRWRYLAIYLLSGLGGSFLAMAYRPTMLAGASGALCGLIGAEGVWLLLNGRYLPRNLVRRWGWGMITNLLLLAFISSVPHVSALGHGGGLIVGAVAALLLNWQRFGPAGWRWLALLPLAALPWAGFELIQWQRTVNPLWHDAERRLYVNEVRGPVITALRETSRVLQANGNPAEMLSQLIRTRKDLERVLKDVSRIGPFGEREVEIARQAKLAEVNDLLRLLHDRETRLLALSEEKAKREAADNKEEEAFVKEFHEPVKKAAAAAEQLVTGVLEPLVHQSRAKRDPAQVEAALKNLTDQRTRLADLVAALQKPDYHSDNANRARDVGRDYVRAVADLLAAFDAPLRAGAEWTESDSAAARKRTVFVEQKRSDWQDWFEKK